MVEKNNDNFDDGQNMVLLKKCESDIKKGQTAFITAARAVMTIKTKHLYLPDYKTAAEYFEAKWDMSAADVSRYKNAAEIIEQLESNGISQLPSNEGQARALREIAGFEHRKEVWQAVVNSGQRITAKLIHQLANPETPPAKSESTDEKEISVVNSTPTVRLNVETKKCVAILEIELDNSVLQDAMEYQGMACTKVGDIYSITIRERDRESLFHNMASWSRTNFNVKKLAITFA